MIANPDGRTGALTRFCCWCCLLLGLLAPSYGISAPPSARLALTPPMGWNSWNAFRLNIDDATIRAQASALVQTGMKAAGYEYVVIDGGWEGWHDAEGNFIPDPKKFPDMTALCAYIHGLGLKVGIHTSPGPHTCSGREASYGHERQDAQTFARWGIDFVKYDWCNADQVYNLSEMPQVYEKMSHALEATGRPILFSLCQYGMEDVWKWGKSAGGQMWRTTGDISDNYLRMIYIGENQNGLEKYAGPGHWNDPDMLEVGNGHMKPEEYKTHMALWCLLAAPLFAGNDLLAMKPATLELLTNSDLIAIDQDRAGIQGRRVWQEGPKEIWLKRLSNGGAAIGLLNRDEHSMVITADFKALGLPKKLSLRDVWSRKDLGTVSRSFTATVPRHGIVVLRTMTSR
ncbi:MAG TPA: glycoside hydrolase family 27 protein [Verrucomicrobiae bacterium]|nr:glycoside hydrolase family 27 protein [Verrucomicrobiae bacterium]